MAFVVGDTVYWRSVHKQSLQWVSQIYTGKIIKVIPIPPVNHNDPIYTVEYGPENDRKQSNKWHCQLRSRLCDVLPVDS